jgi:hypothetical protein
MLDNDQVKIRYAVNGLISLTPDGAPVIGETPGVKGLWSAAAVWIKEAPGVGRMVAEWMTGGAPELDPNEVDIARFYPFARTKTHVWDRAREGFNKIYGIVHPQEQWESSRIIRLSPFHERTRSLGAVYFQTAGWERPHWYESNKALLEEYGDRVNDRPNEWDARWWSLIINAEHLAMRERVALVDLSAFAIFDICGPGALDTVQRVAVSQMDLTVGKAVYTLLLNVHGGIRRDVVIVRTGKHSFRVTTGAGHGGVDKKLFADNLPEDGSAQLHDQTSALCTVGVWGPSARDLVASVTEDDVSNAGSGSGRSRSGPCESPMSGSWDGRSTPPSSTVKSSGTSSGKPARRIGWFPSVSGFTAPPPVWKRAIVSTATIWIPSTIRWKPAWPCRGSSPRTSSARRPT